MLFLHDVEVNTGSAKVHSNAGAVLMNSRRYGQAIAEFERAIQIAPDYAIPVASWGHALLDLGRTGEAMEKYERALELGSESSIVNNNLGYLLVERNVDPERGVKLLEKAVEQRPDVPDYLDSLGWGYFKLGRLEEAHDLVRRSLELDESGPSGVQRRKHLEEIEAALRAERRTSGIRRERPRRTARTRP